MNVAESHAIQRVIRAFPADAGGEVLDDLVMLAYRSHAVLHAGLTGADVRQAVADSLRGWHLALCPYSLKGEDPDPCPYCDGVSQ